MAATVSMSKHKKGKKTFMGNFSSRLIDKIFDENEGKENLPSHRLLKHINIGH